MNDSTDKKKARLTFEDVSTVIAEPTKPFDLALADVRIRMRAEDSEGPLVAAPAPTAAYNEFVRTIQQAEQAWESGDKDGAWYLLSEAKAQGAYYVAKWALDDPVRASDFKAPKLMGSNGGIQKADNRAFALDWIPCVLAAVDAIAPLLDHESFKRAAQRANAALTAPISLTKQAIDQLLRHERLQEIRIRLEDA